MAVPRPENVLEVDVRLVGKQFHGQMLNRTDAGYPEGQRRVGVCAARMRSTIVRTG
jgi:hypothetical protein